MDDSNKNIIIFDGICILCNQAVYFLHKKLRYSNYKFVPSQSEEGQLFISIYKLEKISEQSIVLIKNSKIFTKSDAILEIIEDMPISWQLFKVLKIIPKKIRNMFYDLISKYRYIIFGKSN